MTSRERVRAAIHFQKPDRLPIDLGGMSATSINAVLYDKLMRHLGIDSPTKVRTARNMLAEVELEVLDRFHADVVPVDAAQAAWSFAPAADGVPRRLYGDREIYYSPSANIQPDPQGGWLLCHKSGEAFARMPADGFYFDMIHPPLSGSGIDPARHKPDPTIKTDELDAFTRRARYLFEATDKSILGWGSGISFFGLSLMMTDNITQGSLDDWLCLLMADKDTAHDMMARSVDAAIERTRTYYQAAGKYIDVWGVASDDAGTQRAGLIAPELFAEMIAPHYKRLCGWIHANTHWKTFLHSCGSIYHYLPAWIDAGIDIINPVQISAANMEPERLVKDFGGKVVFWGGGCESQHMLPYGTPEQVREHVRHNIEVFGSGTGGFVFNQVHNIQPHVPVENIVAMFDAAYEFGG